MVWKTFKWAAVATGLFVVFVGSVVFLRGVPMPPNIRTEDIGRVGWEPLFENLSWFNRFRSRSVVAVLPDGSGYLVSATTRPLDTRVHRLPTSGGSLESLPMIPRNATNFYSDVGRDYLITRTDVGGDEQYRLFRWDLNGRPLMPITPPGERVLFGAFEPGGARIAYTSNRRNGRDFDVYLVDPLDVNTDRRVVELKGSWTVAGWSPDGARLLLNLAESNTRSELHLLDLASGSVVPATERGGGYSSAQWSRDGRSLFYASNRGTEFSHLRRLDLESGLETVLSGDIPWDVSSIEQSVDGGRILISVNEGGESRYYFTDPLGSTFEPYAPAPPGQIGASLLKTGSSVLVNHVDGRGIARTYLHDLDTGSLDLLIGTPPEDDGVPEARLIHYPTFDKAAAEGDGADGDVSGARMIPAFVYPGAGPGPHPVTISVHGGPEAQARISSSWGATQKNGVTVITPNVRGSTGYGRTYEQLDNGMKREDAVRDIGALLDWIEAQPDLDEDRVAIVGGSYGGYMVLASLVHYSDRIRCGVDRVGISHFVTFLENTADYRRDLRRAEYGDERVPEMREFLESISPLTNADRITSRLMVVQGANDPRVPLSEALQLIEKIRTNGKRVPYIEASDEGHGFKKPWNQLYAHLAEQEMLSECLGVE